MVHKMMTADGGLVVIGDLIASEAIKAFCTGCMGWGEEHPEDCTAPSCPLFPFRGKTRVAYHKEDDMCKATRDAAQKCIDTVTKSVSNGAKQSSCNITRRHVLKFNGKEFMLITDCGARIFTDRGDLKDHLVAIIDGMGRKP